MEKADILSNPPYTKPDLAQRHRICGRTLPPMHSPQAADAEFRLKNTHGAAC